VRKKSSTKAARVRSGVTVHDESRFDLQFADCIGRQFVALIVDYAECHSWGTAANGPRESVLLFWHQEAQYERLHLALNVSLPD
jgi:hypothetical protein